MHRHCRPREKQALRERLRPEGFALAFALPSLMVFLTVRVILRLSERYLKHRG